VDLGPALQVELSHPDPAQLDAATEEVQRELNRLAGVFDVENSLEAGTREVQLRLKDEGRTLGLTLDDLAQQMRAAFFGVEASGVQRGREDVSVCLRLLERVRGALADVEDYRVTLPQGGTVPVRQVAAVRFETAPAAIQRVEGTRTGARCCRRCRSATHSSPSATAGRPRSSASCWRPWRAQGFVLALFAIYVLIAIPFGHYVRPLVVMAAPPFGVIGAAAHLVMGLPITVLSLFGIIGLVGVIVNDALVMIDFIGERMNGGWPVREAISDRAKTRLRPILLTPITTFLDVAPLVFETSL